MQDLLFDAERKLALTVPCVYCHRPAGQECVNPRNGKPLQRQTAHLKRIVAAQESTVNA